MFTRVQALTFILMDMTKDSTLERIPSVLNTYAKIVLYPLLTGGFIKNPWALG
jgi:hypothetical protein